MKKLLAISACLLMSVTAHAKDIDYIGTRSNPIPLRSSGPRKELPSVTLYLYQDHTYDIMDNNAVLFSGTYSEGVDTITFSDHTAYANMIYFNKNGDKMTCLQTVMYKPDIYKYKSDWFCPAN